MTWISSPYFIAYLRHLFFNLAVTCSISSAEALLCSFICPRKMSRISSSALGDDAEYLFDVFLDAPELVCVLDRPEGVVQHDTLLVYMLQGHADGIAVGDADCVVCVVDVSVGKRQVYAENESKEAFGDDHEEFFTQINIIWLCTEPGA